MLSASQFLSLQVKLPFALLSYGLLVKELLLPSFFQLLVLKLDHLDLALFLLSSPFHLHSLHFSSIFKLLPLFFGLPFTLLELFSLKREYLLLSPLDFLNLGLLLETLDLTLFLLSVILFL